MVSLPPELFLRCTRITPSSKRTLHLHTRYVWGCTSCLTSLVPELYRKSTAGAPVPRFVVGGQVRSACNQTEWLPSALPCDRHPERFLVNVACPVWPRDNTEHDTFPPSLDSPRRPSKTPFAPSTHVMCVRCCLRSNGRVTVMLKAHPNPYPQPCPSWNSHTVSHVAPHCNPNPNPLSLYMPSPPSVYSLLD